MDQQKQLYIYIYVYIYINEKRKEVEGSRLSVNKTEVLANKKKENLSVFEFFV